MREYARISVVVIQKLGKLSFNPELYGWWFFNGNLLVCHRQYSRLRLSREYHLADRLLLSKENKESINQPHTPVHPFSVLPLHHGIIRLCHNPTSNEIYEATETIQQLENPTTASTPMWMITFSAEVT